MTRRRAKPTTKATLPAWRRVNRVQLGELLGVHPDTVTDYVRQGMPMLMAGGAGKEGRYDTVACLAWWRERQGRNKKEAAQARAYEASAELNELKLAQQRGELLPREQVVLEGQHFVKAWSASVRALPRRLEQAGLVRREDLTAVQMMVRELLTDIANWRTMGDLERAAAKDDAA